MARNGSGIYLPVSNSFSVPVSGTAISDTDWIALLADLTTAMSASIANDGQTTCSARIPLAAGLSVPAGGILFPATQSAQSDVNNLDDYEEGTFTPAVSFGGGTTGITYTTQVASYTKIGNRVLFQLYVKLSSKGSSTGTALVTGLPFTSNSTTNAFGTAAIVGDTLTGITGQLQVTIAASATTIALTYLGTGTAAVLDDTKFQNASGLFISGHYFV